LRDILIFIYSILAYCIHQFVEQVFDREDVGGQAKGSEEKTSHPQPALG